MADNGRGGRGYQSRNTRGGRGGAGRGRNGKSNSKKPQLKGQCEELGEHVYTVGDAKQADRYTKTTEAICNHILRTFDQGEQVTQSLQKFDPYNMELFKPEEPDDPANMTELEKLIQHQEVKDYCARKWKFNDNMTKAYALILGQCTLSVKNKLETRQDWEAIKGVHDPIRLLTAIKEMTHNYQDSKYPIATIYDSLVTLFTMKQQEKEGLSANTKRFKNAKDVLESQAGIMNLDKYVQGMETYNDQMTDEEKEKCRKQASEHLSSYAYMQGADPKRSGKLTEDLANSFALGEDRYPKDMGAAAAAIINYQNKVNIRCDTNTNRQNQNGRFNTNTNNTNNEQHTGFAQRGGRDISNVRCYACGELGHYANACPNRTGTTNTNDGTVNANTGATNAQTQQESDSVTAPTQATSESSTGSTDTSGTGGRPGVGFVQVTHCQHAEHRSPAALSMGSNPPLKTKILLDNQSTDDIFGNRDYLTDIKVVPNTLKLHTNGGVLICNTMGYLKGYGYVWFHEDAITNVLSRARVKRSGNFKITYDDARSSFIMENIKSGRINTFTMDKSGLYTNSPENAVTMVSTVEENKSLYSKGQVVGAKKAKHLYHVIGYPSIRDFKHVVQTNRIKNCPVTVEDINICEKIFGPDVHALKGKSVRKKPRPVIDDYVEIPKELIRAHQGIVLCADVMWIDGVPSLLTISKNIKLHTIRYIESRTQTTLLEALDDTFVKYNHAGFEIKQLHADPEFQCVETALKQIGIDPNIASAKEHIPEIERAIRVVKERYRAMYHRLPYSMWPRLMIIRGATDVVKWLNTFPPKE